MPTLTRILNNQITDNTIEWQKLKDGTLVGQKFNANLTLNSNVVVQGNLTVFGSYITTTSTNTNINDPLVIFNSGYTGSPTYDIGILIDRNLAALSPTNYGGLNAAWVWREAEQSFQGLLTTETGTTAGAIDRTAFANVIMGNTVIKTTVGEVVDSTSTSSGALIVQGGVGITANLNVGVDNDNWNKIAGNTYFGTTDLAYPAGSPSGMQSIQTVKTFAGTPYHVTLVDSGAAYSSSFTQNTSAQGGQLSIVTYQSGNDINLAPNSIFSMSLAAANGSVVIQPTTDSLGNGEYVTGALISQGGAAIQGNLNVAGPSTLNGVLIKGIYTGSTADFDGLIIGANVDSSAVDQVGTTIVGMNAARAAVGANATTIGAYTAFGGAGAGTTLLGAEAGAYGSPDTNNTFLGFRAGAYGTDVAQSIFLGYQAGSLVETDYNVIIGSFDGNNNPYYDLNISDRGENNIVVADGTGNIRIWVDPAGTTRVVSNTIATYGDSASGAFTVVGGVGIQGNIIVGGNAIAISNVIAFGGTVGAGTSGNIYIGHLIDTQALGDYTVVIGHTAGNNGTGANVTIVGDNAGKYNPGDSDTLIGREAGHSHTGINSTMIGALSGKQTTGNNNQFFGYNAGSLITTGNNNVILGAYDGNASAASDNIIYISDGEGNPRVYIDNSGSLQIIGSEESTSAYGALRVEGGVSIAKRLYVGGDTTLSGNLNVLGEFNKVNAITYTLTDPILELNTGPNGAALGSSVNFDVGIRARHWYDSASRDAFFGRADHNGAFEYYAIVASESGNVITGTYGNVVAGEFHSANSTQAADKTGTVGAITTLGGASIARELHVGEYSYISGVTNSANLISSASDAYIEFSPSGLGTVVISPAVEGSINNMTIGQADPADGKFSNIVISSDTTGYNFTMEGSGFANISPTGTVIINPVATGNMDNVYIGNTTPRQAAFTAANIGQDLVMQAFTANSVLFISPSGNLSVDEQSLNFSYQRATANTFSTVHLAVGTNGDFTGTDTVQLHYQGDSYLAQSDTAANTTGQSAGWTVSTSRGTVHTPANVQAGDFNGVFGAYAYTGATPGYKEVAGIKFTVEGTELAANGIGGETQIWTKQDDGDNTLAVRISNSQVATFYGQVAIANSTTSTTTTDGALYVQGGAGIGGNLNVSQGARFNDAQNADRDFYVRGSNDATLIWGITDSSYNAVLIGNSATAGDVIADAKLQIWSSDSIRLPVGNDAQRPGTPVEGMFRYNLVRGDIEFYDGNVWFGPRASSAGIVTNQQFNGDAITTDFELSREATSSSVLVSINGVVQVPGGGYSYEVVANSTPGTDNFGLYTTLRFSEAPAVGDLVDARVLTIPFDIRGISSINNFVGFQVTNQNFGANVFTGSTQANTTQSWLNDGAVAFYGMGNLAVGTSPVVVDSFGITEYRSAKYYFQVSNPGLGEYESSEVMVVHDGTTAYRTQYARIYTGANSLGSVAVTINSGNVDVSFTGVNSGNYVKTRAEYVTA